MGEVRVDPATEVRCACGRLLACVNHDTGHYELRRRGKPVAVVTSGELHCVCGESVRVGSIGQAASLAASSLEDT